MADNGDPLRDAYDRRVAADASSASAVAADEAYAQARVGDIVASMDRFLALMAAAGNPGLKRPVNAAWTGRKSWDGWIYPDRTATSYGPKSRKPFEAWAYAVVEPKTRDLAHFGDGKRLHEQVDRTVAYVNSRLAGLLSEFGVRP